MGLSARTNFKEKKTPYKTYRYTEEGKKGVVVSANNPAHAMQLLAAKLNKRIDKSKIVEVDLNAEVKKKDKKDK